MTRIQPRLPKGHRDFLPGQVRRRNYLLGIIRGVFAKYGMEEIETPAVENLETLTGKYGEEGDRLLFKILDSGDYLKKVEDTALSGRDLRAITPKISSKGLRYDLTVPLARYVVQHQNELAFPFRRFHIGPVWRGDRPAKGRYREFYQCDADIIGSDSDLCEIELTEILAEVFRKLNMKVEIQINHREILEAIVAEAGASDHYQAALIAIDKLDKIGEAGVRKELTGLDLEESVIRKLFKSFTIEGIDELDRHLSGSGKGTDGLAAIRKLIGAAGDAPVIFKPALARGLDYYTGLIWEVKAVSADMGTIAAGGRYANLTEMFGGRNMSGVGISFGVERIYDLLEAAGAWPDSLAATTDVLVINFGEKSEEEGIRIVRKLRAADIPAEIYPEPAKLKKQMSYADQKGIPHVLFLGEDELEMSEAQLKDMCTGEQERIPFDGLAARLSRRLG